MCIKITQKKFQLKRNKIDQSIALSIWGIECGENIVDWREYFTKVPCNGLCIVLIAKILDPYLKLLPSSRDQEFRTRTFSPPLIV